jgi:hypothetical protein
MFRWLYKKTPCDDSVRTVLLSGLRTKTVYRGGEHVQVNWFWGLMKATMSTLFNPGTWFYYYGHSLRVTVSRESTGLCIKKRPGRFYYHILWWHGEIGWSFPWRAYAVGKP